MNDHDLAADLAGRAGKLLLAVREEYAGARLRDRKDAGDRRSQEFLAAELARARPEDAVLSEEAVDDLSRLDAERVWIIDPLDGTREFGEPGRMDWAVHVALWQRTATGGDLAAGAVALPAQGSVLATPAVPPIPAHTGPPRIIVSRTRAPSEALDVRDALGATLVEMGSAGAKVMALVQGVADVYVHAGGQYEWDSAAPVAVARAARLHTSRLNGDPLTYNRRDTYLPDLVVCRPEYADTVLAVLR